MLTLLLGKDWIANRNEILSRVSRDVAEEKPGRILLVPELISHDAERRLAGTAGDTASRYAEVLSFTRLVRRVSDYAGTAVYPCLDNGGRIAAMATVSMFSSPRDSTLSVNSEEGVGSPPAWSSGWALCV